MFFIMSVKQIIDLDNNPRVNILTSIMSTNKQKLHNNIDQSYEVLEEFLKFRLSYNNIDMISLIYFLFSFLN